MTRTYGNRMAVLKIPKSGGVSSCHLACLVQLVNRYFQVVELDSAYRERVHQYQLHTYFYGHVLEPPPGLTTKAFVQAGEQTPDLTLHLAPLSTSVNFGDITIYRIGEGIFSSITTC